MHKRASSSPGATIACVGQAAMQRVHVPQRSGAGRSAERPAVDSVDSREVRITPRNSHEPSFWLMMQVFLPIHPMPAYLEYTRSIRGPVSTYARVCKELPVGSSLLSAEPKSFRSLDSTTRRRRITASW